MIETLMQSMHIRKLNDVLKSEEGNTLINFWKFVEDEKTPLIEAIDGDEENMLVTVVWKDLGNIEKISVIGEFFGFNPEETRLSKIENTDIWYRSFICPKDVRSLYLFTVNATEELDWSEVDKRLDPFNPKQYICPKDSENPERCTFLSEVESLLEMPAAKEKKYIFEVDDKLKGKLELFKFESRLLKNIRRVWIYTPANYDESKTYGITIFMDGWEYINIIKAPTILDNLIAGRLIPPICALFIESSDERDKELACYKPFVRFLTEEILPWAKRNYTITNKPEETIVAGFSFGALTASYAALSYPEIFGKVLAQSGYFSWKPEEDEDGGIIREFERNPRLPIDFYLDIGTFELRWSFISDSMKKMTNVLYTKGYKYQYNKFTGGHVHTDWQDTLSDGLIFLMGLV